jgi:uncharacterized delta-60 repeat protein
VGGWGGAFVTNASLTARLLSDGQLDVSYGLQGKVGRRLAGHGTVGGAIAFGLTSTDKIAALSGRSYQSQVLQQPYLEQLDPAGAVDSSFSGGFYVSPNGAGASLPTALLVQADDKLVVASSAGSDALLTRINTDGSLDSMFGTAGYTAFAQATASRILALTAEPNGKLLVAGSLARSGDPARTDGFISRVSADGALDAAFGTTVINPDDSDPSKDFYPGSVLRTSDGGIIVAGTHGTYSSSSSDFNTATSRIGVVRLLSSPEFRFPVTQTNARVDAGVINLGVMRVGDTTDPVTVSYTTVDGTATSGVDYTGTSGTVTWEAGDGERKSIRIALLGDANSQSPRQFTVKLSNASEGYISNDSIVVSIAPRTPSSNGSGGGGGSLDWMVLLLMSAFIKARRR